MYGNEASRRPGDPRTAGFRRGFITLSILSLAAVLAALVAFGAARPAEGAPYSVVVDNAQSGRFTAPGAWKESGALDGQTFGESYAFASPDKGGAAKFKVKIPSAGSYAVFARWPASGGHNASTPIGVATASGLKWTRVNQRTNGNRWVGLGTFKMAAGDRHSVFVSRSGRGGGRVVADAVRIVKATPKPARQADSILGRPIHSQAEAVSYARSVGSAKYIMQTIPHYYKLGPKAGIAPDFLVAQAMLETGYGRYGGDARPWNMAGIKKGGNVGDEPRDFERPSTAYEGVRMHVNHMAAYTNRPTIGRPHDRYYDARAAQKNRGYWVSRISQLGGGVWAVDPNYAPKIRNILNDM